MSTYVYKCQVCGQETENTRSIHLGPQPGVCVCGGEQINVIFTSVLKFGDMEIGDDDFSLRYRVNGASEAAKRNRTQGKTNVNAILRKWGPKGKPLEARTDIDRTKLTKAGLRPPGVEGSLEAPPELSSSQAKGVSAFEIKN